MSACARLQAIAKQLTSLGVLLTIPSAYTDPALGLSAPIQGALLGPALSTNPAVPSPGTKYILKAWQAEGVCVGRSCCWAPPGHLDPFIHAGRWEWSW